MEMFVAKYCHIQPSDYRDFMELSTFYELEVEERNQQNEQMSKGSISPDMLSQMSNMNL